MKAVGKYIVITEIKEQHKTDSGILLTSDDSNQLRYKKGLIDFFNSCGLFSTLRYLETTLLTFPSRIVPFLLKANARIAPAVDSPIPGRATKSS